MNSRHTTLKQQGTAKCFRGIARGARVCFVVCLISLNVWAVDSLQRGIGRAEQKQAGTGEVATNQSLGEAAALLQSGRLAEAETATRKIVAESPHNAEAHTLLGVILDQRGLSADAEHEYHLALALKPNSISALSNLGVLLARTNRASEAIQKFEAVLRVNPEHPTAVFNLGALYAARGDYKRAIPLLEKTAGISAGNAKVRETADPSLLLTLLNAYVHAGRRKEALELSRRVEQAAGAEPKTLFTLALSLAEAHEYDEAVRLFKRTNELLTANLRGALQPWHRFLQPGPVGRSD